ncbi:TRAP transporter small permease [Aquisalimonas lutea]|uniref:TRAP transporter small permease n=1 Tax=Aquisalimonas lutea TaxID=1327750 RepID=UPI0025B2F333|nr:TRAP transporter small permease [Aquisalimonas lutea]MDN3517232.1 TRAP transporter small permease [Aquisalimonas lutea]
MRFWTWITRLDWGLASVGAGLCLLAMMLITVISVFGRYVLGMNLIPGSYNVVERVLFPLIVFWALPLAHREDTFPRLGFISEALPPRGRGLVMSVVLTVETVVFVALLYYTGVFAWDGYVEGRQAQIGSDYWPIYPVLVMVPLAFGLMLLEMFRQLGQNVIRAVTGRP